MLFGQMPLSVNCSEFTNGFLTVSDVTLCDATAESAIVDVEL